MVRNETILGAAWSNEFRDFIADLFAAAAAMQSIRRAIGRRLGLGATELGILFAVARLEKKGAVCVRDVADHLHVAAAHITSEVNALARSGLLEKNSGRSDNRVVELTLSREGKCVLQSLEPALRNMNVAMFGTISRHALHVHGRFCRSVVAKTPTTLAALKVAEIGPKTTKERTNGRSANRKR